MAVVGSWLISRGAWRTRPAGRRGSVSNFQSFLLLARRADDGKAGGTEVALVGGGGGREVAPCRANRCVRDPEAGVLNCSQLNHARLAGR